MRGDHRRETEFVAFAESSQHRLLRQAVLLTGDVAAAQDLVQHTLTTLYLHWARVETPLAYGQRTLVRSFLTDKRRERRERELTRLSDGAPPENDRAVSLTMRAALGELPARMRAVVVLRYWEDLSVEQTAELLGCSTGTVKSAAHRGLERLRVALGEKELR